MSGHNRRRNRKKASSEKKRLIGWLVSYGLDDMGQAYEIRAGRTFIGSKGGTGESFVTVAEHSISAPHSAMHASPKHQVRIQDLFSEHGTFLCRSDSKKEEVVSGPIDMEHGDWIRLGKNTKFQLCLIDSPRRQI